MTFFAVVSLIAALLPVSSPKAEVRNVRIYTPKLAVSRQKVGAEAIVGGQIRVDMFFARNAAKCPVLKLACLCEANGGLSVHTVLLDRPRTCDGMKRSDIMAAFKNAGVEVPYKEREEAFSDPARFTPYLSEVTKDAYSASVYGTAEVNKGYFRLGRSEQLPKIVLYRIELWQNGVMVSSMESSRTGLARLEIPEDWYQYRKYPHKFKYIKMN